MNRNVKILGLAGSLSPNSTSLAAARIALEGAREAGADVELIDIASLQLPMYAPGAEPSEDAVRLADAVADADGLVWSSPLYHGTISGSFKNALDWLELLGNRTPPYLTDKVVGLISTAGGSHGLQAINTLEYVVRALRGWAVPLVVPVSKAWQAFDSTGALRDPSIEKQLRMLGREVVRAASRWSAHPEDATGGLRLTSI